MRILKAVAIVAACTILSGAALKEPFELLLAPSTAEHPRNSEADMLLLRDGRLLVAWIEFYGSSAQDWGAARIEAMISKDQGRSWHGKFTLQENIGQMNVMEP